MAKAAIAVSVTLAAAIPTSAIAAQSVKDVVGATPFETIANEALPKLFIGPPLAEPLSRGAIVLQYRTENFHILPTVGAAAVGVSPRIGHLHIAVDDLPWHWAEATDNHTIVIVGLPPGPHTTSVDLADPQHHVLTGQVARVIIPPADARLH